MIIQAWRRSRGLREGRVWAGPWRMRESSTGRVGRWELFRWRKRQEQKHRDGKAQTLLRVANVSWYLHKGILSSSKHSPDDYRPHLAPVYWWDCKTGQYQAFCFTVIVVATVHVAVYTTIDIAVQYFLSSPLPSDSWSARAGDSYWAGKGVPPGSEALCSTGANSSFYNSTGIAFSVPIWDVLKESPCSSPKHGLSLGI